MEAGIVDVFCHNCRKCIAAYKNEKGVMKYQCSHCGAVNISSQKGRRKIIIELIAPPSYKEQNYN